MQSGRLTSISSSSAAQLAVPIVRTNALDPQSASRQWPSPPQYADNLLRQIYWQVNPMIFHSKFFLPNSIVQFTKFCDWNGKIIQIPWLTTAFNSWLNELFVT